MDDKMQSTLARPAFPHLNPGYNAVFRPNRLSLGLVVPLETYISGPVPEMTRHKDRARFADDLGFAALWLRDVPFNVPSFGDAGQIYDPFVYLGFLASQTERIALGIASLILPLRHPAHSAKAAASVDHLSGGRLILGVASGDRPEEYPALNRPFPERGAHFRESFDYIRQMAETAPTFDNAFGCPSGGMDLLPKPLFGRLPLLITGGSQQDPEWRARHGDGWITYPRPLSVQAQIVREWHLRVQEAGEPCKPVMQPLYVDLVNDPDAEPHPIHLGFRSGIKALRRYLTALQDMGVNHVAINLRFNQLPIGTTMATIAREILPDFSV